MSQITNNSVSGALVHVAVAVVKDKYGKILITKRSDTVHQGGLWEFPGGKVERNENVNQALKRELYEEVGINIIESISLIKVQHNYTDKSVLLDVFTVNNFSEQVYDKEGQEYKWVDPQNLSDFDFPEANYPIIDAILLPDKYMITGEFTNDTGFLGKIQQAINNGITLIQLRAHHLEVNNYLKLCKKTFELCHKNNIKLMLNTSVKMYIKFDAHNFSHGLHLTSNELKIYSNNLSDKKILLAASIHNEAELILAQQKRMSFAVLSPVHKTSSHPDAIPVGWDFFRQITDKAIIPIYALGGMQLADLQRSKELGGQGICAIGLFWEKNNESDQK